MTSDKIKDLIGLLANRTDAGGLRWERTAEDGMFQTVLAGFTIQIFQYAIRNVTEYEYLNSFGLRILDDDGTVIESLVDREFAREQGDEGKEPKIREDLRRIYSSARRTALGADKAIDTILTALANR
jgi:hypothetical protein